MLSLFPHLDLDRRRLWQSDNCVYWWYIVAHCKLITTRPTTAAHAAAAVETIRDVFELTITSLEFIGDLLMKSGQDDNIIITLLQ